jgi:5-(carboxyamino)imidazole ribonucleotide synthase
VELLTEERVDIDHELAVMVARRASWQVRAWPPLRTTQVDGICTEVVLAAPSPAEEEARDLAVDLAGQIGRHRPITEISH